MSLIRWQDIRLTHRNQLHSLHTDNEQEKSELNNAIPFTVAEKMKYLCINLMKYIKDLYDENYKMLGKITFKNAEHLERDTMFMDWKIHHSKDISSS